MNIASIENPRETSSMTIFINPNSTFNMTESCVIPKAGPAVLVHQDAIVVVKTDAFWKKGTIPAHSGCKSQNEPSLNFGCELKVHNVTLENRITYFYESQ